DDAPQREDRQLAQHRDAADVLVEAVKALRRVFAGGIVRHLPTPPLGCPRAPKRACPAPARRFPSAPRPRGQDSRNLPGAAHPVPRTAATVPRPAWSTAPRPAPP